MILFKNKHLLKVVSGILIGLASLLICIRYAPILVLPGPDSVQALKQNPGEAIALEKEFSPKDSILIVLQHSVYTWKDNEFKSAHSTLYEAMKSYGERIGSRENSFEVRTAGHSFLGDEPYISSDGSRVLFVVNTSVSVQDAPTTLKGFSNFIKEWKVKHHDYNVSYVSNGTLNNEMFDLINSDLDSSLLYSIPITFFILLWSFQTLAATFVTLMISIFSLLTSLASVVLVSHIFGPVNAMSAQLVVLLVLALCTDYSLFLIQHIRAGTSGELGYDSAIFMAMKTTGKAIFWSGLTVSCSLMGLFVMHDTILSSMAMTASLSVVITLGYTLCILPSVLHLLGKHIERGVVRKASFRSALNRTKLLTFALRSPLLTSFAIGIPLVLLAYASHSLNLGSTVQLQFMPSALQSRVAYEEIKANFPMVIGDPFSLIVQNVDGGLFDDESKVDLIVDKITEDGNVVGPLRVEYSSDKSLVRLYFIRQDSDTDAERFDYADNLSKTLLPDLEHELQVKLYASGKLVYDVDQAYHYKNQTPRMIAIVLFLSFLFVLLAFRSVVIAMKAIVLNVLSCGAAFGLLVLIFQNGIYRYGAIESFVPALLFCVLFGLSMDYHIFLISRMSEIYKTSSDTRTAVFEGILQTYGSISAAAVIMVSVFVVIASLALPVLKQLGTGLAFAVLIDATVIRLWLLPALMMLMGRWNWYTPSIFKRSAS